MVNNQTDLEKKIEEIIAANTNARICKECGGGGWSNELECTCDLCKGTGVTDWDFKFTAKKLIDLFTTHEQQIKEKAIKEFFYGIRYQSFEGAISINDIVSKGELQEYFEQFLSKELNK